MGVDREAAFAVPLWNIFSRQNDGVPDSRLSWRLGIFETFRRNVHRVCPERTGLFLVALIVTCKQPIERSGQQWLSPKAGCFAILSRVA